MTHMAWWPNSMTAACHGRLSCMHNWACIACPPEEREKKKKEEKKKKRKIIFGDLAKMSTRFALIWPIIGTSQLRFWQTAFWAFWKPHPPCHACYAHLPRMQLDGIPRHVRARTAVDSITCIMLCMHACMLYMNACMRVRTCMRI